MKKIATWNDFESLVGGRDIYIYGGNVEGVGISRMVAANGLPARGFLDTRRFNNGFLRGHQVIDPAKFAGTPQDALVIICTKHRESRGSARKFLQQHGFVEDRDFIYNSSLCQYYPTIETVGVCNLRCFSCDMGLAGANRGQKMITVETFTASLAKLRKEVPFLNSIGMYLWGEPLLHPKIGELIRIAHEHGVATEFSTNLNNIRNLDSFIEADPDILIVTSSGFGPSYNITHTGGDFETFRENCKVLREKINHYKAETFVKYHYLIYKENRGEELEQARAFAQSLGFHFVPILATLFPGRVHDYVVFGEPLPPEMIEANKHFVYDIDDQIRWAQERKDKPCPSIKAFPTIKWNGNVMHCCNMTKPEVGNGYLENTLAELEQMREASGFCDRCKSHGVHRVFEVNGRDDYKMSEIAKGSSGLTPKAGG